MRSSSNWTITACVHRVNVHGTLGTDSSRYPRPLHAANERPGFKPVQARDDSLCALGLPFLFAYRCPTLLRSARHPPT